MLSLDMGAIFMVIVIHQKLYDGPNDESLDHNSLTSNGTLRTDRQLLAPRRIFSLESHVKAYWGCRPPSMAKFELG